MQDNCNIHTIYRSNHLEDCAKIYLLKVQAKSVKDVVRLVKGFLGEVTKVQSAVAPRTVTAAILCQGVTDGHAPAGSKWQLLITNLTSLA